MTIRIGLIGVGGIGRQHAAAATAAGSQIAGIFDTDGARASELAAEIDGAVAFPSLEKMLDDDSIPAVVIAVPNHLHKELALRALASGKDVLLEKPMGLDIGECDEILAAAAAASGHLQLGFVSRFAITTQTVKAAIDEGRLGRIYHVHGQFYRRRGIPGLGGWFTTKTRSGGGVLIDLGVHLIDLAMHLTGRPAARRVSGTCTGTFGRPIEGYVYEEMWGGPPRPGGTFDVEDGASGLIRFDGGLTVDLSATWAANVSEAMFPSGLLLLGDRGGCFYEMWGDRMIFSGVEDGKLVDTTPTLPDVTRWDDAWRRQHVAFAETVANRTPPEATGEHGRAVQAVLDAWYRSAEEGREVEVG